MCWRSRPDGLGAAVEVLLILIFSVDVLVSMRLADGDAQEPGGLGLSHSPSSWYGRPSEPRMRCYTPSSWFLQVT